MEKQGKKAKNKILKFLPKALSFQNPPFSPSRDKDPSAPPRSAARFSGPIFVSIVPREARRRGAAGGGVADTPQEPTSPKVSCLGQIKQRHHKKKSNKEEEGGKRSRVPSKENKKNKEVEERMSSLSGGAEAKAPVLGQMRRFASSRGSSLSNFDWAAQVMPEDSDRRKSHSDDEDEEEEEEEGVVRIPFSAPLAAGGGGGEMRLKPKKEINLWKRRTMAPPRPLNLLHPPAADS